MSDTFIVNRGSTLRNTVTFPGTNLTGHTVDLVEVSQALTAAGGLTVTVTNAAAGQVELLLTDETSAQLPIGRIGTFRIRITQPNGDAQTTNQLWIGVQ